VLESGCVLSYKVSNLVDVGLTERQIAQDPDICTHNANVLVN